MSGAPRRIAYLTRTASVYLRPRSGPLSFWYETPEVNEGAFDEPASRGGIGEYYMTFSGKADYRGPFDTDGIPLLDYRGDLGRQYNPIAVAQYGLAVYNRYRRTLEAGWRARFVGAADWLVANLAANRYGLSVWHHHFDWPYRETLVAPWYSGLAQGAGVSLLIRTAVDSGDARYADAARAAFDSLRAETRKGGVLVRDADGGLWIEEYLVEPPSHILNGFIWALWGIRDFALWSRDAEASAIFDEAVSTLEKNLGRYDAGFWSLYEVTPSGPRMLASPYYHRLHVIQLHVLHRLTGKPVFREYAERWAHLERNPLCKARAVAEKLWFKFRRY